MKILVTHKELGVEPHQRWWQASVWDASLDRYSRYVSLVGNHCGKPRTHWKHQVFKVA